MSITQQCKQRPLSRIGVGLAALGRPGYVNLGHASDLGAEYDPTAMEARTHAVLDAALESGVRYFDTARSYGRAEDFLASWLRLRRIAPASVTIGSKWGYIYTAGWRVDAERHEVKDHSLPVLRRQLGESRERLGSHLALYQVHSATLESGVLDRADVLAELGRLRDSGVRVGLTLSGAGQAATLEHAIGVEVEGERLFQCVQATWNLLEPSCGDALSRAHRAGMGVIVKEGLANGRLTERNRDPAFGPRRRALEEVARRLGARLDALALAAILDQP
ncbi:MAG: aldo/keto reductase, partial [Candidatus Binatia bacterium]